MSPKNISDENVFFYSSDHACMYASAFCVLALTPTAFMISLKTRNFAFYVFSGTLKIYIKEE